MSQHEEHRLHRSGWLRAAVMGANDGIVSTASLMIGVAAAAASSTDILLAGTAGLVAGALSMAAGEYVSVSSQADIENADLKLEANSLKENPKFELRELTELYQHRGLDPVLARQVAEQLTAHDALAAHARDELGLFDTARAQPLQAALVSAVTFAGGAALPLLTAKLVPLNMLIPAIAVLSLLCLAALGALAANAGGAPIARGALRVTFWGALAMTLTAAAGHLFGVIV